ncbi:LacI family transcriptional regulator [Dyadobacter jejuensis]|uniref:LacI family transcriptional regulator n=1 Tax=Dyadobacter jejuensis TaxID=1082580 RepID=A0A316AMX5_9BACT|nr:LacI family DNA-binding transcriptional regulator [Dyadobacter jejuensis]PWJ58454.1 LacI family transcriptional regulator [Dyadobacter jejuensis]
MNRSGYRPDKPATIKDVARALNISISTVSRALRNMPDVNQDTRQAVLRKVEELDYQPNQIALSLITQKTHTIGVIIPNLDYFFSMAVRGIDDMALETGYTVMICQSNESFTREMVNTQRLMKGHVDGLIVSNASDSINTEQYERLLAKNFPIVFFDRANAQLNATKVILDNISGASQAVTHLIEQGCRRIAYLAGPANLSISQQRMIGYKDTLQKFGLTIDESLIVYSEFDRDFAYRSTLALLERPDRPDAIFAVSDRLIVGALLAIKEKGIKIPEDIALVGFNDEPVVSLLSPPISSVAQSAFDMGRLAAKLLVDQLNSDHVLPPQTIMLKPTLKKRASSIRRFDPPIG